MHCRCFFLPDCVIVSCDIGPYDLCKLKNGVLGNAGDVVAAAQTADGALCVVPPPLLSLVQCRAR